MRKKENKMLNFVILVLILLILFLVIRSTYSKYATGVDDQTTNIHIANWNIKLNDKDIKENKNFTRDVQLTPVSNPNIAENVTVPTSEATFNMKLESTGTELSYEYTLKVAQDENIADDPTVDIKSTYEIPFDTSYVFYSGNDYDPKSHIFFNVKLNYADRDTPVQNDEVPISLTVPEGDIERIEVDNCKSVTRKDNIVTFIPYNYKWSNDNNATISVRVYYNNRITLPDNPIKTDIIKGTSINGKTVIPNNVPDYRIYAYSLNGGPKTEIPATQTELTATVNPPKDGDGKFTGEPVIFDYIFYVTWYDGEDNKLSNSQDVEYSKLLAETYLPITLTVKQVQE